MSDKIEVTITIGDKQITLVGPEPFVREEVRRLTSIVEQGVRDGHATSTHRVSTTATEELPASERDFVRTKRPKGHSETVAVLAYFLTKSGQIEFKAEDIRRAYARVGIRPPKVMAQSLRDAKNLNDFLESGSKAGTFRLSPHGERTVAFDLPEDEQK